MRKIYYNFSNSENKYVACPYEKYMSEDYLTNLHINVGSIACERCLSHIGKTETMGRSGFVICGHINTEGENDHEN